MRAPEAAGVVVVLGLVVVFAATHFGTQVADLIRSIGDALQMVRHLGGR